MSMIGEFAASAWEEVKAFAVSLLCAAAFVAACYLILRWAGVPATSSRMTVSMALFGVGAIMMFMGRHMTWAGFYAGFNGSRTWVDVPTPIGAWRFGGVVCWAIGVACAVFID